MLFHQLEHGLNISDVKSQTDGVTNQQAVAYGLGGLMWRVYGHTHINHTA